MNNYFRQAWSLTKITLARLRFLAVFLIVGLIVGYWGTIKNYFDKWTRPALAPDALAQASDVEYYCVMHPHIIRGEPGNCPLCGMPLAKRKKGQKLVLPQGVLGRVQLTPRRIQLAGIQVSPVEPRRLVREIHAVGIFDYDETKVAQLSARVAGRVDELFVQYAGQKVRKDQKLYSIYSPDVVVAMRNYLDARKAAAELLKAGSTEGRHDAEENYKATMDKLRLWGMTGTQLREIEARFDAKGEVPDHFSVTSPIDGVVVRKNIYEGGYVQVGDTPFVIASMDPLWLQAQINEADVPLVHLYDAATVTTDALPDKPLRGTVTFLGFQLDPARRTLSARIEIENPDLALRPGMFARATLRIPLSADSAATQPTTQPTLNPRARRAVVFGQALQPYLKAHEELVADRHEKVSSLLHEVLEKLKPIAGEPQIRDDYAALEKAVHATMGQDLPAIRESFKKVSLALLAIGKTTGIPADGPAIQETHCPMEKGTWLQPVGEVRNPYAPKMLTCGNPISNLDRVAIPSPTSRPALPPGNVLSVPRSAVIDTGRGTVVFVVHKEKDPDTGQLVEAEGVYDQRLVELGPAAGDYYQVLGGLTLDDRVVTQGAFLLDAENRLNPIDTEKDESSAATRPTTQPTAAPAGHQH